LVKTLLISFLITMSSIVSADRIKDIAVIEGVRDMPVVGYGLVVGLSGTGDGNINHTQASLRKMLTTMGVKVDAGDKIKSKNVASVMVSGRIPPFARIGHKFDLTVTSIGDAKSIKDGTLLMTTLKGATGDMYAIAGGQILVSGLAGNQNDNSFLSKDRSVSGIINGGGTVEKNWKINIANDGRIRFLLKKPDFTTSSNMAKVIDANFGEGISINEDSMSVSVKAPAKKSSIAGFISMLENLDVATAITSARVVVNSHTGTVVISSTVRVSDVVVSHGSLIVEVKSGAKKGLQEGEVVEAALKDGRVFEFSSGIDLKELVDNINKLGIGPSDLVAILQSLREAGAMHADLIVI